MLDAIWDAVVDDPGPVALVVGAGVWDALAKGLSGCAAALMADGSAYGPFVWLGLMLSAVADWIVFACATRAFPPKNHGFLLTIAIPTCAFWLSIVVVALASTVVISRSGFGCSSAHRLRWWMCLLSVAKGAWAVAWGVWASMALACLDLLAAIVRAAVLSALPRRPVAQKRD